MKTSTSSIPVFVSPLAQVGESQPVDDRSRAHSGRPSPELPRATNKVTSRRHGDSRTAVDCSVSSGRPRRRRPVDTEPGISRVALPKNGRPTRNMPGSANEDCLASPRRTTKDTPRQSGPRPRTLLATKPKARDTIPTAPAAPAIRARRPGAGSGTIGLNGLGDGVGTGCAPRGFSGPSAVPSLTKFKAA